MITLPCPFAQSIAAYMTLRNPAYTPAKITPRATLKKMRLIGQEKRPVERKGLGENIDIYA